MKKRPFFVFLVVLMLSFFTPFLVSRVAAYEYPYPTYPTTSTTVPPTYPTTTTTTVAPTTSTTTTTVPETTTTTTVAPTTSTTIPETTTTWPEHSSLWATCNQMSFKGGERVRVTDWNGVLVWDGVPPHTFGVSAGVYTVVFYTNYGEPSTQITIIDCPGPPTVPSVDTTIQGELLPPNGAPICEQYPDMTPYCDDEWTDTIAPPTPAPPATNLVLPETGTNLDLGIAAAVFLGVGALLVLSVKRRKDGMMLDD